jgi:hypothetical protein
MCFRYQDGDRSLRSSQASGGTCQNTGNVRRSIREGGPKTEPGPIRV